MWTYTGETETVGFADEVTLRAITSEAEGDAWEVVVGNHTLGRVQEYSGTIQLGASLVKHGPLWAFTPLKPARGGRWSKTLGQTIFGFLTRDDAVRYGQTHH